MKAVLHTGEFTTRPQGDWKPKTEREKLPKVLPVTKI